MLEWILILIFSWKDSYLTNIRILVYGNYSINEFYYLKDIEYIIRLEVL